MMLTSADSLQSARAYSSASWEERTVYSRQLLRQSTLPQGGSTGPRSSTTRTPGRGVGGCLGGADGVFEAVAQAVHLAAGGLDGPKVLHDAYDGVEVVAGGGVRAANVLAFLEVLSPVAKHGHA